MLKALAVAVPMMFGAGCVTTSSSPVPDAVRAELAPGGKLRAGMNLGNALFTAKDTATGELRGVSVDLMNELARRLGVPLELVVYPTPGDVADAVDTDNWDVAILAIEQARAQKIAFSPPMTEIEAGYVVRKDSPLASAVQVDAKGVRIAAAERAGYELFLTRTIRNATVVKTKSFNASIDLFNQRGAEALSGLKPTLLESMGKVSEGRLLADRFMTVNHGLGTPRSRTAAAAWLEATVNDLVASGFIARSIDRHAVQGLAAVKQRSP